MGGTCSNNASNSEIATAILTIPQTINTNNMTGTITYQYHHHESSCVGSCGGRLQYSHSKPNQNGDYWNYYNCSICGKQYSAYDMGTQPTVCTATTYTCGHTDGQIIGATITY